MSLYPYAIGYAQRGLPIFPCQQRGKEPACTAAHTMPRLSLTEFPRGGARVMT